MKSWKRNLTLPAALGVVFSLAACGSDDPAAPTSQSTNTGTEVVTVSGNITSDTTWTPADTYLLRGAVFVQPGVTLTIQAGTRIVGEKSSIGTLVVARGGRLQANGTQASPIVFTSDQANGSRRRGDWGGLIVNGAAPINVPGGEAQGEGDTGAYGGNDPSDSSGGLQYVRVEFAGIEFSPDNELNGIALQGVGGGTTCDHLQVHFNKDDGFEWFGGTVSCKYLVSSGIGDDSFDWTEGWAGRGQFWIAQQRGDDADQGIEADNNAENNELQPRANPTLYNVTLIGAPGTQDGSESDIGMLLREGTAGGFFNFIVLGFKEEGVVIDGASSIAQANAGALFLQSAFIHANGEGNVAPGATSDAAARWINISEANPMLTDPFNVASPNFTPMGGSPAISGALGISTPPSDGFFEPVSFIGAVGSNNWVSGWTTFAQN